MTRRIDFVLFAATAVREELIDDTICLCGEWRIRARDRDKRAQNASDAAC